MSDRQDQDIRVSHWWTFHQWAYGAPISVKIDRIVGVIGDYSCALILEGHEDPINIEEDASYVQDIVDAYHLFAK